MRSAQFQELEGQLANEQRPRERAVLLLQLNKGLNGTDFSRAVQLCSEALSLAKGVDDDALLAQCHADLARALWKTGEMVKAQSHFEIALMLYAKLKDDAALASVYCSLGIVHGSLDDHANAMEFFEKGVELSERTGDDVMLAHNLGNLGHVHKGLNDCSTALRLYAKALAIDRELGEAGRQGVSNMLTAIAGVLVFQQEFEGAIEKLEESLSILEELGDMRGMATTLSNMGITYHEMGQFANAIAYLNRSLAIAEKVHYRVLIPDLHQNLADLYASIGDDAEALAHLEKRRAFGLEEKRLEVQRQAERIIDRRGD